MSDLATLLRQAECAAERVVGNNLANITAGWFGSGAIVLEAPYPVDDPQWQDDRWLITKWIWPREAQLAIIPRRDNRWQMYERAEKAMEVFVGPENVTDTTMVDDIVGTWEYLSAAAYSAACFYPGNGDRLIAKYVDYKAKADLWKRIMPPLETSADDA